MTATTPSDVGQKLQTAFVHHPHLLKNKFHFYDNGRVVVEGEVETYFEKQIAQESLRGIDGISEIQNELVVSQPC